MSQIIDRCISVIVPVRNGAAVIGEFVPRLTAVLRAHYSDYEVLIVDDGSRDGTRAAVEALMHNYSGIRYLLLSRHFGGVIPVMVGLDSAIGDYAVAINPLTDAPELVPTLIEQAMNGCDIVYGVSRKTPRKGLLRGLLSGLFHWYAAHFIGLSIPRNLTHLRCFSRGAINALTRVSRPQHYYRCFDNVIGFRSETFAYYPAPSTVRTPLYEEVAEGIHLLIENAAHPLRLVSILGLTLAMLNLVYVFYIVGIYFFKPHVMEGWTTLSLQVSFLFMCVLIMLTAMSEYIGHILQNVQNRPAYFVREETHSPQMIIEQRLNVVKESSGVHPRQSMR